MPSITTVNVNLISAPLPSKLQKSGAIISQGGTTLAAGASLFLAEAADLTAHLPATRAITSLAWAGSVVTAVVAAHGLPVGTSMFLTISGATPAAYNGTFLATITDATHFTYPLVASPGANTVPGFYISANVAELTAAVTTFFAQGAAQGVFVLELGQVDDATAIAALAAYIVANPNSAYTPGALGFYYIYLVPKSWDANTNYLALIALYEGATAKLYFFTTTKLNTYTAYTTLMKDVVALVEAPKYGTWSANVTTAASWTSGKASWTTTSAHGVAVGDWFQMSGFTPAGYNGWFQAIDGTTGSTLVAPLATNPGAVSVEGTLVASAIASVGPPATELTIASAMHVALSYDPGPTNKVTPYAFSFLFGVTPFPKRNNSGLLQTIKDASTNYVDTGGEGGITDTILMWGTTEDARPFEYWYSVDWAQIQSDINISNTVINGSNDRVNPLYYDQNGIDRLQDTVVSTMRSAITNGLATGVVKRTSLSGPEFAKALDNGDYDGFIVVNAVPLVPYLSANPSDYRIGKYGGLSVQYIPARGFIAIVFNINVTDLVVP